MNVQVDGPSTVALTQTKALVPGYLLTPFGWAAKPLAAIIQSDPALLRHIFELDIRPGSRRNQRGAAPPAVRRAEPTRLPAIN